MEINKLTGFIFLPSYAEARNKLKKMNDNNLIIEFDDAIINFGIYGIEPNFNNPMLEMVWDLIIPTLEGSIKNYKSKIENGKKGGRPKKDEPGSVESKKKEIINEEVIKPQPEIKKEEKVITEKPQEKIDINNVNFIDEINSYDDDYEGEPIEELDNILNINKKIEEKEIIAIIDIKKGYQVELDNQEFKRFESFSNKFKDKLLNSTNPDDFWDTYNKKIKDIQILEGINN